jgi:hypothetical protein
MLNTIDDDFDAPVITVAPEIYNAILLAKRVMVVTQHAGRADFFGARQCLMTAAGDPGAARPDHAALLRCMVGG